MSGQTARCSSKRRSRERKGHSRIQAAKCGGELQRAGFSYDMLVTNYGPKKNESLDD